MVRRIAVIVLLLLAISVLVYAFGPRVAVDTTIRFDPAAIGADPESYLARQEAAVANIRGGLQKEILWANADHRRTPLSVVYIHGFSASKGEVRPLPDLVAVRLGANLFYTRLTGQGQDGAAMATASVNAWINDYEEALAIGRSIGERVVVIATSTGASLAVWAATQPDASEGVAAIALISPNFGIRAKGAQMLTMPWGRQIAQLVAGKEHAFEPRNALHEKFWTTRYPIGATLPMQAITELAYGAPVETAETPALFIFSDADRIVRADLTREIASRWGGPNEVVPVDDTGDPDNHVIAGDALSPQTTGFLAQRIAVWVEALTAKGGDP